MISPDDLLSENGPNKCCFNYLKKKKIHSKIVNQLLTATSFLVIDQ